MEKPSGALPWSRHVAGGALASLALPAPQSRWLLARALALGGLLLAEILWLSLRIDTGDLSAVDGWWAGALGRSPSFVAVLFAVGAATALVLSSGGRARSPARPVPAPRAAVAAPVTGLLIAGHLTAFTAFAALTLRVFDPAAAAAPGAAVLLGWLATGLAAASCWTALAVPPRGWPDLLRRGRRPALLAAVVGGAAWTAGMLTQQLWRVISGPTFWLVERLLLLLGQRVATDPDQWLLAVEGRGAAFAVILDESCSGYQGIGLVWVFLGAYLWFARRELRFPRALVLLPAGTLLIWLTNAVRIVALIVIGAWFSEETAAQGFHSQAGWIAFLAVALGLVAVAQRSGALRLGARGVSAPSATAAHLVPFLCVLALGLIGAALGSAGDLLYPLRLPVALLALWHYWPAAFNRGTLRQVWSVPGAAIGAAAFALWLLFHALGATGAAEIPSAASLPQPWSTVWLVLRLVGFVAITPLVEELAFRGFLARRLIAADFESVSPRALTWMSFLASSLAFGILHEAWLIGTLMGMCFALAYRMRGRLSDAVAAHALTNALIAAYGLAVAPMLAGS